jgi:hypothetical protein
MEATEFVDHLAASMDELALAIAGAPEDAARRALDRVRLDLSRSLRTTFGAAGAATLADRFADVVEKRSQEMIQPAHRWLN